MPSSAPHAAKPTKHVFDAFNSSATGHQRADNTLSSSTSWRDSRTKKLNEQFGGGAGGGKRISDTVGAGSLDFGKDGRTANGGWVKGAKGLRKNGQQSILECTGNIEQQDDGESIRPTKRRRLLQDDVRPSSIVNPFTPFIKDDGKVRESSWTSHEASPSHLLSPYEDTSEASAIRGATPETWTTVHEEVDAGDKAGEIQQRTRPPIFANLAFYVNGSTAPLISDHRLKQIISDHSGRVSIALGRRSVTHVIIGRPSSVGGSGGSLAGSKLHKEITQLRGSKVNFVTAEWVVESIKAGKRLPESQFAAVRLAAKGSGNLTQMFASQKADKT